MWVMLKKAFWDSRKTYLWMGIGLALYGFLMIAFFPSMIEQSEQMDELLQSYPPEFLAFMGIDDPENLSIGDPGFYLQTQFTIWALLILGAMVIVQAFNAITNAERDNSMDMLLSLPISRREMMLARVLNTAIGLLIVLSLSVLAFWLSTQVWPEFAVSLGQIASMMYGMFFPIMVVAGFTYLLTALIPSSRHYAGALAYLFLMGSYLLYSLSQAVDALEPLQPFLIFSYYDTTDLADNGPNLADWTMMSVVALLFIGGAWFFIDQKELGV